MDGIFIVEECGPKFKIMNIFCKCINIELKNENSGKEKPLNFQLEINEKKFRIESTGKNVSLADIIMENDKFDNYLFQGLNEGDTITKKVKF
jgi:hypothetical protein